MKEVEFLNMDLDLFYSINGFPIHIASAGGYIPLYYQNLEYAAYNLPQHIREIKPRYTSDQIIINPALREIIDFDNKIEEIMMVIDAVFSRKGMYHYAVAPYLQDINSLFEFYIKKIYGTSFINMAKRGFLSFDRTDITLQNSELFHWVAMPYDYSNNPHTILDIIPNCEIDNFLDYVYRNSPFQLVQLIDD